jgi:hypothetical protein
MNGAAKAAFGGSELGATAMVETIIAISLVMFRPNSGRPSLAAQLSLKRTLRTASIVSGACVM